MSGIKTFKKCKSATFTLDGTSYKIGKSFFFTIKIMIKVNILL